MKVTVKKDGKTFTVTSKPQLDAFKADGWVEVKEEEKPKRKREE